MPAGRTNAKALLQKVNSQLRGERVPIKTKEEDELAVYLQNISQKTQQASNVGYEEYGDISISSGVQSLTPRGHKGAGSSGTIPAPASSKFLKKKKTEDKDSDNEDHRNNGIIIAGKKKVKDRPSKAINERQASGSALDKANVLTKKLSSWSSRNHLRFHQSVDSDTDESIRISESGKRPGSADTNIGRDGNKFLKKKGVQNESKMEERSRSPQLNYQRSLSQEKGEKPAKGTKTKGEIVRTLGTVYLTSEEESLAEFIHGLSASESLKKPQNLVTKKQQKWRKKSPSPSGRASPSIHMSRSPSPFKNRSPSPYGRLSRSQSQESDLGGSMASEILDIKQRQDDSASSGDRFGVNLMDIASLLPAESLPDPVEPKMKKSSKKKSKGNSQSSSPFAFKPEKKEKRNIKPQKKKSKELNRSNSKDAFFESLGIQMVDDIFEANVDVREEKDNYSVSDESEIRTEKSEDRRKSQFRQQDSASEIITEFGGRSSVMQRSTEDVISERLGDKDSSLRSASYTDDDDDGTEMDDNYSETFISDSETVEQIRSEQKDISKRRSMFKSSSDKRKGVEKKVVLEEKSIDIASTDDRGFTHHYTTSETGIHVTPSYGLQYVDPTPVAAHVINADALEALTSYSPNMLALQDMMRSQLQLVENFMQIQNRIYKSCMDGLSEDFQYTTLEDTKEYINKHRKPRLTFDEALKLVDLEDNRM